MKKINKNWGYVFVVIPLLLQLIFFFTPLIQGFWLSLTNHTGLSQNYEFIGLTNYFSIFNDSRFSKSLIFTGVFTLTMIVGQIVIGLGVGLLLNTKMPGRNFFRTAYFFPAVLSTVVVGLIFNQIFNYGVPQIGELLNIDFLKQNLLANPNTAPWVVSLVALWQGVAMPIVIFLAGLQSIPKSIVEAAKIDGASSWQTFLHIKLPYLLPSISIVFILALKMGLTAFDNIYALTGGGPQGVTMTMGLLVYDTAFVNNQAGYANAIAMVLFAIIVVISIVQLKLSNKFEV
ncbi:carbohydrate ABC transporter permease [Dolosigranulum pigrum]|uniref:carbohydrate ABC transporter permease n=1 Tax=Dolosigranulum pigrum TaxID=29394 RepID=UPI001AD86F0B|nr:sugar ABC transporter permease [Dolosigranulum pigrum]QTJ55376.1 sugar ABC transporter permease [Dolosigranulum pigrum]